MATTDSYKRTKCLIRGLLIDLTPEEEVRQKLLAHMFALGYPKGLISVEKKIGSRRFDIVCYHRSMQPLLLIECKANAPGSAAASQVTGYNAEIKAPFLCIAGGSVIKTFWNGGEVPFLPAYAEMCKVYESI